MPSLDPPIADVVVNGGDGVAAAAIRDIEEKAVVANNASKSTMIIHASKKVTCQGPTTKGGVGRCACSEMLE